MPSKEEYASRKAGLTAKWESVVKQRQANALATATPTLVELPSGLEVDAIRVDLLTIWEAGRIPDALTSLVTDMMNAAEQTSAQAAQNVQAIMEARWEEFDWLLNVVWVAAVVAPEFTLAKYSQDKTPVRHVDVADRLSFFNWCQGVTDHLAAFRGQTRGSVRPVADEPVVSEVHTGGTPGSNNPGEPLASVANQPGGNDVRPMGGRKAGGTSSPQGSFPGPEVPDDASEEVLVPPGPRT